MVTMMATKVKRIVFFVITRILFLFLSFLWIGYCEEPDPENDLYLAETKARQLKYLSYKKLLTSNYAEKDADVLLLTMIAIDNSALFPDNTSLEELGLVYGKEALHKVDESTYFVELQKGKSKNNNVSRDGGFTPQESNEWYLIIRLRNDKKLVAGFYIYFGLSSQICGFLEQKAIK